MAMDPASYGVLLHYPGGLGDRRSAPFQKKSPFRTDFKSTLSAFRALVFGAPTASGPPCGARDLPKERLRPRRRFDELWRQAQLWVSPTWHRIRATITATILASEE